MNHIFHPFIGRFVVFYFDNILFYNPTIELLQDVFIVLRKLKFFGAMTSVPF